MPPHTLASTTTLEDRPLETNPFAPPKAHVADVVNTQALAAPPLWNPIAAARWSLLLSPAFGAYLHMKNWQAMGETQRAETARQWFIGILIATAVLALVGALLPDSKPLDVASRAVGIGLLIGWYYGSGKGQVIVVAARYGKTYPRKGWSKALVLGLLAAIAFLGALVAISIAIGSVLHIA